MPCSMLLVFLDAGRYVPLEGLCECVVWLRPVLGLCLGQVCFWPFSAFPLKATARDAPSGGWLRMLLTVFL